MTIPKSILDAMKKNLGIQHIEYDEIIPKSSLNTCWKVGTCKGNFFIKVNEKPEAFSIFEAETKSLNAIDSTATLRVPKPLFYGKTETESYLVMEYLELQPHSARSMRTLGFELAKMHLTGTNRVFGFECLDFVGTTPQPNDWDQNWIHFFKEQRLNFQLKLIDKHYDDIEVQQLGEQLLLKLPSLFDGIRLSPSLLHGDLWIENTATDLDGNCVLFDPACYYGHYEAELGMCRLFGGFTEDFYEAYHHLIAKEPGFEERNLVYQLYHALNHYNLFGVRYRPVVLNLFYQIL